jgi:putative tryptophan/tyrosine transport system substrate-binding protein
MEEAFEKALRALGWFRDQNIQIEYRYEVGRRDDPMISEISSLGLDAAVTRSTRLALALTLAAPAVIFLAVAVDPVATGLVSNIARPGGRITGIIGASGSGF